MPLRCDAKTAERLARLAARTLSTAWPRPRNRSSRPGAAEPPEPIAPRRKRWTCVACGESRMIPAENETPIACGAHRLAVVAEALRLGRPLTTQERISAALEDLELHPEGPPATLPATARNLVSAANEVRGNIVRRRVRRS